VISQQVTQEEQQRLEAHVQMAVSASMATQVNPLCGTPDWTRAVATPGLADIQQAIRDALKKALAHGKAPRGDSSTAPGPSVMTWQQGSKSGDTNTSKRKRGDFGDAPPKPTPVTHSSVSSYEAARGDVPSPVSPDSAPPMSLRRGADSGVFHKPAQNVDPPVHKPAQNEDSQVHKPAQNVGSPVHEPVQNVDSPEPSSSSEPPQDTLDAGHVPQDRLDAGHGYDPSPEPTRPPELKPPPEPKPLPEPKRASEPKPPPEPKPTPEPKHSPEPKHPPEPKRPPSHAKSFRFHKLDDYGSALDNYVKTVVESAREKVQRRQGVHT